MKRALLPALIAATIALAVASAFAPKFLPSLAPNLMSQVSAAPPPISPALHNLNVSVGRWVFHGTAKTKSGKPGSWTWNEDCRWSPNHLYLECTFSNVWSGKPVESLVVDTYNSADHSYWHYELYASGEKGDKPFVSRMDVNGNTWIEHGREAVPGKQSGERIVYYWTRPIASPSLSKLRKMASTGPL